MHRAGTSETGNAYVLLWVDKHDDAYQWARRRTCHINRVSGALQVVDVESAEEAVATSRRPTRDQRHHHHTSPNLSSRV